jgi:hypothetical protein
VHSSTALALDSFAIDVDGRPGGLEDVWPGFAQGDRVGVVLRDPVGALGASALIALSVTAFYESLRVEHGDDYHRYADFYLFGAGCEIADYGELDVWPDHKHVVCAPDAESILRAVNDRAITRLVVPDAAPLGGAIERQTRTSAEARLRSAIAYSPTGLADRADLSIRADRVVESYVEVVLFGNPQWIDEAREAELKAWRASLFEERKSAREAYRRLTVAEALDAL